MARVTKVRPAKRKMLIKHAMSVHSATSRASSSHHSDDEQNGHDLDDKSSKRMSRVNSDDSAKSAPAGLAQESDDAQYQQLSKQNLRALPVAQKQPSGHQLAVPQAQQDKPVKQKKRTCYFALTEKAYFHLKEHEPELLRKIFPRVLVFARMKPRGKVEIVEQYQRACVVGFVGDGGNDTGALRA